MEEDVLNNGETPYENTTILYTMHFFFTFTAPLAGMMNCLFLLFLMPCMGAILDKTDRLHAARICLFAKFFLITAAYGISAYLFYHKSLLLNTSSTTSFASYLLYTLPVLSGLTGVAFSTISQSVEKDWLVVLSCRRSDWLTRTNAVMTQIDSLCNSVAPAITGGLFVVASSTPSSTSSSSSLSACLLLLGLNGLSTCCLFVFLTYLYRSWPALAIRSTSTTSSASATGKEVQLVNSNKNNNNTKHYYSAIPTSSSSSTTSASTSSTAALAIPSSSSSTSSFSLFARSGCAGTMLAYALLYLTVLNYGGLMTVYLLSLPSADSSVTLMNAASIGSLRGGAALMGFLGAVGFPYLVRCLNNNHDNSSNNKKGIYLASQWSISLQAVLVMIAAASFFLLDQPEQRLAQVTVLCSTVLLSRAGLWMFDLGVRQIAQETIPEASRGAVNGLWRSAMAFFELASYLLALWLPDPQHFWCLATISATMVLLACLVFTLTRPDKFPNQSSQPAQHQSIPTTDDA